ncbi:response regulator transcription factor [Tenacibaculum ovolyticum]|uniref:LytR/AlgR family response regulator transcription factor n=1 Tax=Tenacibaculum ovolyticum TaxID=104270 RepID=UPI000426128C|nr:response regulator transcription factor [Tenacibaculum ovolyticum]WBX75470.1 response regulator transcription factor [Tenacibaculum ovolyticum]
MDKVNILIIEDTADDAFVLREMLEQNNYNVVAIASSYQEALTLFYKLDIDLIIIDVFLDGNPDGITFAETISITPNVLKPFVFLTSSKNRQIFERAKLTKPFSFLLKPFNELEMLYALEIAVEKFYEQSNIFSSEDKNTVISQDYLFIKKTNALRKVMLSSILYIEVDDRYCNIITEKEKYIIQVSLGKISELLDNKIFIRTHRKYIVNSNAIEQIILNDNLLILKGNHKVTFSGKYKNVVKDFHILK